MSEEDYSVILFRNYIYNMMKQSLQRIIKDIKDTKWAILIVIAYFVLCRAFFGTVCPLVAFTGFPCPACGLTRAGIQVLQLHFAEAWKLHPFIYPIMALMIAFCVERYVLFHKKMKVLRWCAIILIAAMVIFYMWRMYRYFPGEPPMSYNCHNLLYKIIHLLHL